MKNLFLLHYCSSRRLAVGFAVLVTIVMTVASGWASSINTVDPAPVLNGGWAFDQDDAVMAPSLSSAYVFTLASSAVFRITDQFVAGDVYDVFDGTALVLVTTFSGAQSPLSPVGEQTGEAGWESAQFSHGELELAPGAHSITVEDTTSAFGIPAGFYVRLDTAASNTSDPDPGTPSNTRDPDPDTVPEPATVVLLGIALTGLGAFGLRRKW